MSGVSEVTSSYQCVYSWFKTFLQVTRNYFYKFKPQIVELNLHFNAEQQQKIKCGMKQMATSVLQLTGGFVLRLYCHSNTWSSQQTTSPPQSFSLKQTGGSFKQLKSALTYFLTLFTPDSEACVCLRACDSFLRKVFFTT